MLRGTASTSAGGPDDYLSAESLPLEAFQNGVLTLRRHLDEVHAAHFLGGGDVPAKPIKVSAPSSATPPA